MALLATATLAGCAQRPEPTVGYTYECRPGDYGRKILARVHAIKAHAGGDAVLVSIADGPNPGHAPRIVFAAFERAGFLKSCPTRSAKAILGPEPRFNDTYRQWQADMPSGKAGVYDEPVAQVVAEFRALPVPPFVGEPGDTPAAGLLGPGPDADTYFTEPKP